MQLHSILRALAFACLLLFHAQAAMAGQLKRPISLSVTDARLEQVFKQIESQANVSFVYSLETLSRSNPVTMEAKNTPLDNLLVTLFRAQPLAYTIDDQYIIIKAASLPKDTIPALAQLKGKLVNEAGLAVAGATIQVKERSAATISDSNGEFLLRDLPAGSVLLITGAELEPLEIKVGNESFMTISLKARMNELDQVLVMAYGQTTKRLNTGNISKVSSEEIARQPVSNPLATLHGRVPGLDVSQTSGLPGANINIVIRGDNSLSQGSQPLFVIDGIPFMLNQGSTLSVTSPALIQQSPLNSINPADIASIEVLKDADATAIYGSQGANGVVMITTKKNEKGKTSFTLDYATGVGTVARTLPLMNTAQYLEMRKEGYANDGTIPTVSNAPDLLLWDSTKYTDWTKKLIGGTARTNNLQATLSGGNQTTQFLLSGSYYSETTVFPEPKPSDRITGRAQVNHQSADKKLTASIGVSYSVDQKRLPNNDLTTYIFLAPNAPDLYESAGKLNWVTNLENPLSYLQRSYNSKNATMMSTLNLSYKVAPGAYLRLNGGYNSIEFDEQSKIPISAQRPSTTSTVMGTRRVGFIKINSYVLEPQFEYKRLLGGGQLDFLAGLSFQQRKQSNLSIIGSQYLNDDLLEVLSAAPRLVVSNGLSQYNYGAFFSRLNYNLKNRYLINLNLRRDGSSRFGPANRFSNFGAVGAAWIFSEEAFMRNASWLSFGKLRGSYGITGNDQIEDYLFLDLWSSSTSYQYQGQTGVLQERLHNPYLQWERNKKMEFGLELGFLKNRINLGTSYYRNRSDNQLVGLSIPAQTGFSSIQANLDALVQNTGWEIELTTHNIRTRDFRWTTNANITIPRNKLIRYPGLENSGNRLSMEVGEPLSLARRFSFEGIDPATGVYKFLDINKDGTLNALDDYIKVGVNGSTFYGGMSQQFVYKAFQLDIFFQFKRQFGNLYTTSRGVAPGTYISTGGNQPRFVLDRWQQAGDNSLVQKYTAASTSDVGRAYQNSRSSSMALGNTSFVRLKNVAISWELPIEKLKYCSLRWYINAQNLLTVSNYKGVDPENQNLQSLPPLRIITTGVSLNF